MSTECRTEEIREPAMVRTNSEKLAKRHMLLYMRQKKKMITLTAAQGRMNVLKALTYRGAMDE